MSRSFNGTSARLRVTTLPDLSGASKWSWHAFWNTTFSTGTDQIALEYSDTTNSNIGFTFIANESGSGKCMIVHSGNASGTLKNSAEFVKPADNTWHGIGAAHDFAAAAAGEVVPYLNGSVPSLTHSFTGNNTSATLGSVPLNVMSRAGASLFCDGLVMWLGIWKHATAVLTADEFAALGKGVCPLLVRPAELVGFWPLDGRYSPEVDQVGGMHLTVTSATQSDSAPQLWRPSLTQVPGRPAATGPASLNRDAADTAAATDAATRSLALVTRTGADTAAATDQASATVTRPRTTTDNAPATDAATRAALGLARAAADTAPAADAATRSTPKTRTGADTAAAADVATRLSTRARTGTDSAPATDTATGSVSGAGGGSRSAADSAAATDQATRSLGLAARAATDTAPATDTAARQAPRSRTTADTAPATDQATRTAPRARTAADSAPAADTATRLLLRGRSCADLAAAADAAARAALGRMRSAADTAPAVDVAVGVANIAGAGAPVPGGTTRGGTRAGTFGQPAGYTRGGGGTGTLSGSGSGRTGQ